MAKRLQYYAWSFFVGLGLALLFGILAAVDEGNSEAYIAAAATAGLAGVVGGVIYLVKKNR